MSRNLFTITAAVSFALALAVTALWIRSHTVGDAFMFCHFTVYPDCDLVHEWHVSSAAGGVGFSHHIDHFEKGEGAKVDRWKFSTHGPPTYPFFGTWSLIAS